VILILLISTISFLSLRDLSRSMAVVTEETTPIVIEVGKLTNKFLVVDRKLAEIISMQDLTLISEKRTDINTIKKEINVLYANLSALLEGDEIKNNLEQALTIHLGGTEEIAKVRIEALQLALELSDLQEEFQEITEEIIDIISEQAEEAEGGPAGSKKFEAIMRIIKSLGEPAIQLGYSLNQDSVLIIDKMKARGVDTIESNLEDLSSAYDVDDLSELLEEFNAHLLEEDAYFDILKQRIQEKSIMVTAMAASNTSSNELLSQLDNLVVLGEELNNKAQTKADESSTNNMILLAAITLAAVILGVVVSLFTSRLILTQLNHTVEGLAAIAKGDFTISLDEDQGDEFSDLAKAVNALVSDLKSMILLVLSDSKTVSDAVDKAACQSDITENIMSQQQTETKMAAKKVNEISITVQEIAEHAAVSLEDAKMVSSTTQAGSEKVVESISSMLRLEGRFNSAMDTVTTLESDVASIGSVLDVIGSISEQTNLLALNAAIEAARAGEQGRGFAVVADEVRSLASRTQDSTVEIKRMIEKLQAGSHQMVEAMRASSGDATSAATLINLTGEQFTTISSAAGSSQEMSIEIANASETLAATMLEISASVSAIEAQGEVTGRAARIAKKDSERMKELAQQLKTRVSDFRLS